MNAVSRIIFLLSICHLLPFLAAAQDISTSREASHSSGMFASSGAVAEFRQSYEWEAGHGEVHQTIPQSQGRLNYDFLLLNRWVQSRLILGATRNLGTNVLVQRRPQLYSMVKPWSIGAFKMAPYLDARVAGEDMASRFDVGLSPTYKDDLGRGSWGALEVQFWSEWDATFSSGSQHAKFTNADLIVRQRGLRIVDADQQLVEGAKQDPDYAADVELMLEYCPSLMNSALRIALGLEWIQSMQPRYTATPSGRVERSFEATQVSLARLRITYQASEHWRLVNQSFHAHYGLLGPVVQDRFMAIPTLTNFTALEYTIF